MITHPARTPLRRKPTFPRFCFWFLLWLLAAMSSPAQDPPDGEMRITLSAPDTWTVSVSTGSLWEYRMEASDDLETWQPLDSTFLAGDGAVHSQRVVVPENAWKAFFRYSVRERTGGVSGNTLTDWDRIYSFRAGTFVDLTLDTDGDGFPDYLEMALGTNKYDILSFPWRVVRVDPFEDQAGHPRDGAIVVYLNRPLPASITSVPAHFVRQLFYIQLPGTTLDILESGALAPGSTMILPGRKAVAFLPSPSLAAGSNHTRLNNYKIDFSTAVTGIPQLVPWHTEFATVNTFDDVGSWVKMVRPGETAIEVALDFAPVIDWSQPLYPSTVMSGNVTLARQSDGAPVAVTVAFDYDTNRMVLQHATPFEPDTAYVVTLGTGFTNLMGKPLLNAFTWSFRTRPARAVPVAGQGPYVTAVAPLDFSTNVDALTMRQITLSFSEAMDDSTLGAATVHLRAHGTLYDYYGTYSYDAASRTLTFDSFAYLDYATRYDLTLDSPAILSAASTPQALQGHAQFVFTTGQNPYLNGTAGTGGMGGPGSGPGGSGGTPGPDQPAPLEFQLSYGDPDRDAGASVKLGITLPDGSQREMQMPNATNQYRGAITPEIPHGSTVLVTPQFLKGNDPDYQEELEEVQVEVSPLGTPAEAGYVVFRQSDTTGAAAAPTPGAWDYLGALASGPFIAQVLTNSKLAVAPAGIVPDANMVGVIGDVIRSSLPGSTIKHFVTPKKTSTLSQDFVELKINIAATEFTKRYEWEGGVAGSAANKRKVSRAATGTGPTVVKVKTKKEGTVLSEMRVWVVWATCAPPTPPPAQFEFIANGSQYKATNFWSFVFTIQPSSIITGIASRDDVPDLRGDKGINPPGYSLNKKHEFDPANGPRDTATKKWDLSRNFSMTVRNPGGILKGDLDVRAPNSSAFWIGQRANAGDPIVPVANPIQFPVGDAEGNDDPKFTPDDDEDADPYNPYSGNSLDHAVGQISSKDAPNFAFHRLWALAVDQTFGFEADFLEFARLELVNDPLKIRPGNAWFRISDFVPWHHALRAKASVFTLGPPPVLGWDNNGSDANTGNINH